MDIKVYTPFEPATISEKERIVDFLFHHLDQYGDAREDIHKAIQYALKETASHGGFVIAGALEGKIVGAVVINRTGMEGYIPENILVYIAVDGSQRGKGIGKTLMQKAISLAQGDIALHVEPDNPARHLYEKLGFTNKYLEMRLKNQ
ncbi:GNAT family N-acetyltransferase [Phaeodactylibacter sp.]|jgi:ribosomal protein S18 acetylase RimI-like enzyme|uniref:GNAT family N-acetyltransferase n=1 Tax=Phaeodactylibacter sp. TaxID=1940289 RepID=UPI0025FD2C51|nr:GNAT family N-acetyltransferase [Phaeodactylibacter sp.]MCI4648208.1 GNAT family N-acetyltransferase [Phaeodactylibacter sp.]MCI5091937.1 GNAT family N-acetyltransferase [Phaeodactylibacter sp.]